MNATETAYAAGWRLVRALPRPVAAARQGLPGDVELDPAVLLGLGQSAGQPAPVRAGGSRLLA